MVILRFHMFLNIVTFGMQIISNEAIGFPIGKQLSLTLFSTNSTRRHYLVQLTPTLYSANNSKPSLIYCLQLLHSISVCAITSLNLLRQLPLAVEDIQLVSQNAQDMQVILMEVPLSLNISNYMCHYSKMSISFPSLWRLHVCNVKSIVTMMLMAMTQIISGRRPLFRAFRSCGLIINKQLYCCIARCSNHPTIDAFMITTNSELLELLVGIQRGNFSWFDGEPHYVV